MLSSRLFTTFFKSLRSIAVWTNIVLYSLMFFLILFLMVLNRSVYSIFFLGVPLWTRFCFFINSLHVVGFSLDSGLFYAVPKTCSAYFSVVSVLVLLQDSSSSLLLSSTRRFLNSIWIIMYPQNRITKAPTPLFQNNWHLLKIIIFY